MEIRRMKTIVEKDGRNLNNKRLVASILMVFMFKR